MTTKTYQRLVNHCKKRHPEVKRRSKYKVRVRFKYDGAKERQIKRLAAIINDYYNFYGTMPGENRT